MITEDFVSFETAKLLKEKGFDETVRCFYDIQTEIFCDNCVKTKNSYTESIAAPTLQMAIKWLREKEWFICIIPLAFYCGEKVCKFGYSIWAGDNFEVDEVSTPEFSTYEEACEAAIKYCLENLI